MSEFPKFEFKPIELPKIEPIKLPEIDWKAHQRMMAETDALLAKTSEMLRNLEIQTPYNGSGYVPAPSLSTESKSVLGEILAAFTGVFK